MGKQEKLKLGNLDTRRDWGHAKDYVKGMWMMLQQDKPDDFILATGVSTSVRDFCKTTFEQFGLDYENYVEIDSQFYRPQEVHHLKGDYQKANKILGWSPQYNVDMLIRDMIRKVKEE